MHLSGKPAGPPPAPIAAASTPYGGPGGAAPAAYGAPGAGLDPMQQEVWGAFTSAACQGSANGFSAQDVHSMLGGRLNLPAIQNIIAHFESEGMLFITLEDRYKAAM
jgi:hypothetical protein